MYISYSTKIKVALATIFMLIFSFVFGALIIPETPEISERKFLKEQKKLILNMMR